MGPGEPEHGCSGYERRLSPVAGSGMLRALGTHSRPRNPLQGTSRMWEGHRVPRSSRRGGHDPIHAQLGKLKGRQFGAGFPEGGVAAHGAPPTFSEARGRPSTRSALHIRARWTAVGLTIPGTSFSVPLHGIFAASTSWLLRRRRHAAVFDGRALSAGAPGGTTPSLQLG